LALTKDITVGLNIELQYLKVPRHHARHEKGFGVISNPEKALVQQHSWRDGTACLATAAALTMRPQPWRSKRGQQVNK
jgi:hypothetical protein